MADSGSILGNAVVRLEDPTLLTGSGKYLDDLDCPGATRVVFVRSSVAHGVLRSVDVEAARAMPGVLAVYHAGGDDLGLAPFQSFPMLSGGVQPAGVRSRPGPLRRRHRGSGRRRDRCPGGRRR